MTRYFDAHNHLQDERLDAVREEAIGDCLRMGVERCVVNATSPKDWARVGDLARRYPFILPAYGVHPWYVEELPATWLEDLTSRLCGGGSVIGEIGIDHWRGGIDRELQEAVFLKQLGVASEKNLPVTIHGLKAWDRLLQLLKAHSVPRAGFLLHSYSGPSSLVESFIDLGAYFSCAPSFFAPGREKKLEIFRNLPLDRILAETDSPDQPPPRELDPYAHLAVNHPATIKLVYEGLAKLRQISESEMGQHLNDNFLRLFKHSGGYGGPPQQPR